jgi:hypothetical protein
MIKIRQIVFAVLAAPLFILPQQVFAADAPATVGANVVAPIAVSQATGMQFGALSPTATAGTVVLGTNGSRTPTNVDLLPGTGTAAAFNVTGDGTSTYSISLPGAPITLNDGGNSMTVDAFGHDAGGSPALSSGTATFNVGATLNIGASQPAGTYSGSYTVSVNYN